MMTAPALIASGATPVQQDHAPAFRIEDSGNHLANGMARELPRTARRCPTAQRTTTMTSQAGTGYRSWPRHLGQYVGTGLAW